MNKNNWKIEIEDIHDTSDGFAYIVYLNGEIVNSDARVVVEDYRESDAFFFKNGKPKIGVIKQLEKDYIVSQIDEINKKLKEGKKLEDHEIYLFILAHKVA